MTAFSVAHAQKQIAIKNLLIRPISVPDTIIAPLLPEVAAAQALILEEIDRLEAWEEMQELRRS